MNRPPPAPLPRPRLLSDHLAELRRTFADHRASLREVVVALESRAFALLMILLALPFVAPVSLPGSSTPFGLIIAVIALQLAFGRLPWLPRRLLDWKLPAGFFSKVVPVTQRIVRAIERVLHPRWPGLTASPWARAVHLLTLALAGLLLALPLPVPLTNTFPAWTILLLAFGLLERDGVVILAGHLVLVAGLVLFGLLGTAITEAFEGIWQWLSR